MTEAEWESLCARCGICCFHRVHNSKTGVPNYTSIRCRDLNEASLQCNVYENRFAVNESCEKITPENVRKLNWLPETCGYRTIAEGRDLQWWHPLISGSRDTVHQEGISFLDKAIISEDDTIAGDLLKYLIINPFNYFLSMRKR